MNSYSILSYKMHNIYTSIISHTYFIYVSPERRLIKTHIISISGRNFETKTQIVLWKWALLQFSNVCWTRRHVNLYSKGWFALWQCAGQHKEEKTPLETRLTVQGSRLMCLCVCFSTHTLWSCYAVGEWGRRYWTPSVFYLRCVGPEAACELSCVGPS